MHLISHNFLTRLRHNGLGHNRVPLEADRVGDFKVWEAHPSSLTQRVLCNRTPSPSLNLLHGGSAWDFYHSLHSR